MTEPFTIYQKHPTLDAYRYGPSYTPYAIVAIHKDLTNAELAAEWHQQDNYCGQVCEGYSVAHDGSRIFGSEESEVEKLRIIHRFATRPHFDE